jgi:hypothetical protein
MAKTETMGQQRSIRFTDGVSNVTEPEKPIQCNDDRTFRMIRQVQDHLAAAMKLMGQYSCEVVTTEPMIHLRFEDRANRCESFALYRMVEAAYAQAERVCLGIGRVVQEAESQESELATMRGEG